MARIEWVLMCDRAFFDREDRLCIAGIVRTLPMPGLPCVIDQVMLVAHLVDIRPVEEVEISVAVVTPGGLQTAPRSADCLRIEMAHEYVLVTLREFPFNEGGIYRFLLALKGTPVVAVDIPVIARVLSGSVEVH